MQPVRAPPQLLRFPPPHKNPPLETPEASEKQIGHPSSQDASQPQPCCHCREIATDFPERIATYSLTAKANRRLQPQIIAGRRCTQLKTVQTGCICSTRTQRCHLLSAGFLCFKPSFETNPARNMRGVTSCRAS